MKFVVPVFALLVYLFSSAHSRAESTPSLNALMTRHTEAIGGLLNWSRVESILLLGTVERDGQSAEIVIVKKRPNKIRATVTLPIPGTEGEYVQIIRAHDGKTGWTATRRAGAKETVKTELDPTEAAGLLSDAGVLPKLLQLWRSNEPLKLLGRSVIEEQTVYILEWDDGNSETRHRFYLDVNSYRTVAHEVQTPADTILTKFSGHEAFRGVYLPTRADITAATTGLSVLLTESVEIGVGIYNRYFSRNS